MRIPASRWLWGTAFFVLLGLALASGWAASSLPAWRLFGVRESTLPQPALEQVDEETADAIRGARSALIGNPELPFPWLNYAMMLEAAGFPELALPMYREAGRLAPGDVRPHYLAAAALQDLGRDEEALSILRELSVDPQIDPEWLPVIQTRLGGALLAVGETGEAEQVFWLATSLSPGYAPGYLGLGKALLANDSPEEAIPHLERALELFGSDRESLQALAEAQREVGNLDAAARAESEASGLGARPEVYDSLRLELTRLRPEYARAKDRGLLALWLGRHADAIDALQRVIAAWPKDYIAHLALAEAYEQAGRSEQAQATMRQAERLLEGGGESTAP